MMTDHVGKGKREAVQHFSRRLIRKPSARGRRVINHAAPVFDGHEVVTPATNRPGTAPNMPVPATNMPGPATSSARVPIRAVGVPSTRAGQDSNPFDGSRNATTARLPRVLVQNSTRIAGRSDTIAIQEPRGAARGSAQHGAHSTDTGHQITSSTAGEPLVPIHSANGTRQAATNTFEPPRLTYWEKAANRLKTVKPETFKKLESMEKKIKERDKNVTLANTPDLLKLAENRERKTGSIPRWLEIAIRDILLFKDFGHAAAALDPTRTARICWAGFCLIIEALVNDAALLEESHLNMNDVTSKMKHWANIELFYLGASGRDTVNKFKTLESYLITLYSHILEFEVEVFHWCNHGFMVQALLSSERKEHWKRLIANIENSHKICSSTFDDCKMTIDQQKIIKNWISKHQEEEAHADILEKTQANKKYQNCGEWLIGDKKFQNWSSIDRKETGNFFWLRGTVGTGKTTLLCRIIQWHLDRRYLYRNYRLAFFYCTGNDTSKTPYVTALLSLLRQAAYNVTDGGISTAILDAYKNTDPPTDELRFNTSKYQELLGSILKSGVRVRIMVDALDQCDEPTQLLKILRDASNESSGQLELLVSSRGYVQVDKKLPGAVIVDINASMPVDDMVTYVTTEVRREEKDERLLRGEGGEAEKKLEEELISIVCEKAGTMFRWAELQLSFFLHPTRTMFEEQLKDDLETFKKRPVVEDEKLQASYDHLFKRNTRDDTHDRRCAIKIYQMLICCKRDLSLHSITTALALDDSSPDAQRKSHAKILGLTRDFIYSSPFSGLKFAHTSAVDYLRNHHSGYSDVECHAEMALLCLKCISSHPPQHHKKALNSRTFSWYASCFWVEHCVQLNRSSRESRGVSKLLLDWLVKDAGNTPGLLQIQNSVSNKYLQSTLKDTPCCTISTIKIAMLTASVCNFVEIGEKIIQSRSNANKTLLDLLSPEDHEHFPKGLYHYTSVRPRLGLYTSLRTPLSWAATYGNEAMFDLLLKHDKLSKQRNNPQGGLPPLLSAAKNGHRAIVGKLLLLGDKVDCDARDYARQTALAYAAKRGDLTMARALLSHGANPSLKDVFGFEPLDLAKWKGHEEVVKLLKDALSGKGR